MKIVFVIGRAPQYRLLAPVVDAALARGYDAECWLNHGWSRDGLKGYQFPDAGASPHFVNGQPVFKTFKTPEELRSRLDETTAHAVVSMAPKPAPESKCWSFLWVTLQHAIDLAVTYPPETVLASDLVVFYSDWWRNWMTDYYESLKLCRDLEGFKAALEARSVSAGFAALDPAPSIDRDRVRARWNIPRDQPVVTLLPFPQGVGRPSFWPRRIHGEPSRLRQAFNMVAHGRFEYWPQVRSGWSDREVVKAIRRFCDRHGAFLLVKSREKTPVPGYTEAMADRCVYDDTYYPATILQALAISNFCVSYYSATVTEAVPLGVPHLCLTMNGHDYCGDDPRALGYFNRFFNPCEEGVFQFSGATRCVNIPDAIDLLNSATLDHFRMDSGARQRYVRKFLAHDDFDASSRVLDRLEQAISR